MTTTTTVTAKTAASTYQQLRGHLAELKLADAAEALPSVLDQATAEGWSLTHTLERLLAIEVTATDARRLTGRFRFSPLTPHVRTPAPAGSRIALGTRTLHVADPTRPEGPQ